jgi:hypothetical protein
MYIQAYKKNLFSPGQGQFWPKGDYLNKHGCPTVFTIYIHKRKINDPLRRGKLLQNGCYLNIFVEFHQTFSYFEYLSLSLLKLLRRYQFLPMYFNVNKLSRGPNTNLRYCSLRDKVFTMYIYYGKYMLLPPPSPVEALFYPMAMILQFFWGGLPDNDP